MIRLDGVSKSYDGKCVLAPVTLHVAPRETLAIIGPSGCGKSTLLRIAVGLVRPDTGTVAIDGSVMSAATAMLVRRRIGYVIQDGGLFPHLTARENVTLMPRHLRWSRERIAARVDELAAMARLEPALLERHPAQLSGGQRQRVALLRALVLDPDVLLLDEPLGALDPIVRAQLQDDLKDVFRRLEKTVLLVTHDMTEAAHLADEIAVMNEGKLVQRAPIDELLAHPADPFVSRLIAAQRPLPRLARAE
jgi:osmoprotectant transport system ATP-binding protein